MLELFYDRVRYVTTYFDAAKALEKKNSSNNS